MIDVDIVAPKEMSAVALSAEERVLFDQALHALNFDDAAFITGDAVAALEAVMPALNDVGWAVVRNAISVSFIEQAEQHREHIVSHSMYTNREYDRLLKAFDPTLTFLQRIAVIGVADGAAMEPGMRRISSTWDSMRRHYDVGDSHTFLGNPLVDEGAAPYILGSEADARFDAHYAATEVEVSGRDLLVLATGAIVPTVAKPDTLIDGLGDINDAPRTVVHERPAIPEEHKRRLHFIAFQRGKLNEQVWVD